MYKKLRESRAPRTMSTSLQGAVPFFDDEKPKEVVPEIDRLILFDREVDLITPCVSQLTYEGLIDEVLGIQHCTNYSPAIADFQQQQSKCH